jgi:hypothetical protein
MIWWNWRSYYPESSPPPPPRSLSVHALLLCILLLNMLHKYKSDGFRPSERAGHNPLFIYITLHEYNLLNNAQYISSVSCCIVLLQGTSSLIMGLAFTEWCQNMCNTSVWIYSLGGGERPYLPSCATAWHISTIASRNGTPWLTCNFLQINTCFSKNSCIYWDKTKLHH